jgi:hypothetical protein
MVQIVDPATGEVRSAGSFPRNEWNQLVKTNPEAATLILELRRRERDVERARAEARGQTAVAVGGLAAGAAFPMANHYAPAIGDEIAGAWVRNTYAVPGTEIYSGPRVGINVSNDPATLGQAIFSVDGATERPFTHVFAEEDLLSKSGKPLNKSQVEPRKRKLIEEGRFRKEPIPIKDPRGVVQDIKNAATNWAGFRADPKNQRLYFATPEAAGVFGGNKGHQRLADLGFEPRQILGNTFYAFDARPGARFLGAPYNLMDNLVLGAATGQGMKRLRFAGALTGALGIGALAGAGVNLVGNMLGDRP